MSNLRIDRKICDCAMWCHLTILSGEPLIVFILALFPSILPQYPRVEQNLNIFFGFLFFSPLLGCILSTILAMMIWRKNRHRHQFIEASGKEVINFLLSVSLYLFMVDTIMILGSYGFAYADVPEPILYFYILGVLVNLLLLVNTLWLTIKASLHATRGNMYHYPFVIRFLR